MSHFQVVLPFLLGCRFIPVNSMCHNNQKLLLWCSMWLAHKSSKCNNRGTFNDRYNAQDYSRNTWYPKLRFLIFVCISVNRTTTVIATLIFCFHLSRRLYETLFVSVYSNTKMNLFHYLLAYTHYTGAILCVVAHSPMTSEKSEGMYVTCHVWSHICKLN